MSKPMLILTREQGLIALEWFHAVQEAPRPCLKAKDHAAAIQIAEALEVKTTACPAVRIIKDNGGSVLKR